MDLNQQEANQSKAPKHLVLDEDVHRALKNKKSETGVNVKDLGNSVLRSVLERPLLTEAIGRRIVSSGMMSEEEFSELRKEALRDITEPLTKNPSVFQPTAHNTFTSGSWEMRELACDPENQFQIFLMWARDLQFKAIPLHTHEGMEYWVILSGAMMVTVDAETQVLKAPGAQIVPQGASHSSAPLSSETMLIVILTPPNNGLPSWVE